MAHRVVAIQQRLRAQQAAAELDVMRAQNSAIDFDLKLKNTLGEQRAETVQERQAYLDKWRSEHNHQLVQARQDLAETAATLNKAHRMKDFTEIIAPARGIVLEVADRSVRSVLREAEPLVTLVPDGATPYVEANAPSRDVSYVKVGDLVRVKLETYPPSALWYHRRRIGGDRRGFRAVEGGRRPITTRLPPAGSNRQQPKQPCRAGHPYPSRSGRQRRGKDRQTFHSLLCLGSDTAHHGRKPA